MYRSEDFVVDWQDTGDRAPINSYVALSMSGRNIGLDGVESADRNRMALTRNAPPIPVGTQLEVGDVQGLMPGLPASLVASDKTDLSLAW